MFDNDEFQEDLITSQADLRNGFEQIGRMIDTAIAMDKIFLSDNKNSFGFESFSLAADLIVAGTPGSAKAFDFSNLSMEDIQNKKQGMIVQLLDGIKQLYQKQLDNSHYFYTSFNFQRGRVNTLKRKLKDVNFSGTIRVSPHITKYMLHGAHAEPVRDMKEYIDGFKILSANMKPFINSVKDLADDDLFTTFKLLKNILTFNADNFFKDRAIALADSVAAARKSNHLKVEENTRLYTTYASDVMLGGGQIVITEPKKENWDKDDIGSLIDSVKYFYMYIYRQDKFRVSTAISGSRDYQITVKDMEVLLAEAEQLLHTLDQLLAFNTMLSTIGAQYTNGPLYAMFIRNPDSAVSNLGFFKTFRIVHRISAILFECVASSYNFSIGNVKKALSIVEEGVKKA